MVRRNAWGIASNQLPTSQIVVIYLRDPWNLLDLTIVVSGYVPYVVSSSNSINLSGLRSLRVLRSLKSITAIASLRSLIMTIFNAIPYLLEIVFVLFFVFLIYAIAALQLFSGLFLNNCTDTTTGKQFIDANGNGPYLCTTSSCPSGSQVLNTANFNYTSLNCAKGNVNPDGGTSSFDNIFISMVQIYTISTMEGWSMQMKYVMQTMNYALCIFFISIVFICSFFLLNLTLAVVTIKFNESQDNAKAEEHARIKHSTICLTFRKR